MYQFFQILVKPKAYICALGLISCIGIVHASPEEDFRRILLQEVSAEISEKSLISEIVEIRFRREFDKWKITQTSDKNHNNSFEKFENKLDYFGRPSTYAGIGTKVAIGFQKKINENFGYRFDASGKDTSKKNKQIGTNPYQVEESNFSLGTYFDWFPFAGNFRISTGINLNKIETTALINATQNSQINGKNATTSSDSLNISYKFSKITPFVGMGYQSGNEGDYGWSSFIDIGVMFGKFDADAKTNLVGQNSISVQDINYEIDTVRQNLFRGNYIPTAIFGMKYSY